MMTVVLMIVASMLGALVVILLMMNFRITTQVEKMRQDFGNVDGTRAELSGRLMETRTLLEAAEREIKQLRSEFKGEIEEKLKIAKK